MREPRWWFLVLVLLFAWLLVGNDCKSRPLRETSIVSFEITPNPLVAGGSVFVAWQAEYVGLRDGGPYCTLQRTFEGGPEEALVVVPCIGSRTDEIDASVTAAYVNYRFSALRRTGQAYETEVVQLVIAQVGVTVAPASVTLEPGASQDFTATVTGASDTSVTWAATCGSISGSGHVATFTAPDSVPNPPTCILTATSQVDASASASAVVTIAHGAGMVNVTVAPEGATLEPGASLEFSATVTGVSNTNITWAATCGVIDGTGTTITYTAPASEDTCELIATSAADATAHASVSVTVMPSFETAPSYIRITNVSLLPASGGAREVRFDISWEESWRGPDRPTWVEANDNWDAAWVFVKYRVDGADWRHATLAGSGHAVPAGAVVDVRGARVGAFVHRSSPGYGRFSANRVGLAWEYAADGVAASASVEVRPFGIDMVYVPEGSFSVGSGVEEFAEFRAGGTANTPFVVSSQSSIQLGDLPWELMWTELADSGAPSGSTHAGYPTGFGAFYAMKYELTQGQYVDFLNTLTQTQADARKHTVSAHRYAITGDSVGSYATSHPFVAMNYISWADAAAFADWAGVRPMTELEFEKAARGPLPPVTHEFAWGSRSATRAEGLVDAGAIDERPTPADANMNFREHGPIGNPIDGPVRAGSFARPGDSRRDAGAGFYGSLELSGNLLEIVVTVGHPEGRAYTGAHGDGTLDMSGSANVAAWPDATAIGIGVRGGSWSSDLSLGNLSVSPRHRTAFTSRSGTYGWRGARSAP